MTELILRHLGATPEQIDRERERIQTGLFGGPMAMRPFAATADDPRADDLDQTRSDSRNQ